MSASAAVGFAQPEFGTRDVSLRQAVDGLKLFVFGMALKILLANQLGGLWSDVTTIGFESLSTPLAWMAAFAYSFQLYFDFWGYSLMAIGIGRMLGFHLPENFRQPFGGDLFPLAPVTDDAVLTKNTAQRTSAEKHRPGAPFGVLPADAGLLPEMQGSAGGFQGAARAAEAHGSGSPVHPAAAGAQGAVGGRRDKIGFRHNIQSPLCKVCCPQYTTFYTGRAIL